MNDLQDLLRRVRMERGWAAVCLDGIPRPFIDLGSVHAAAADARDYVGSVWAREGETPRQGWKRARKNGWRVVRVDVSLHEDTPNVR